MKKVKTLEELVKKYLDGKPTLGTPDTYDTYKHKNDLAGAKSYSDAAAKLYASSKRNSSSFGANNRKINNKGWNSICCFNNCFYIFNNTKLLEITALNLLVVKCFLFMIMNFKRVF